MNLPIRLDETTGLPFYRQLVDQLTELIRSGALEPGARLPSVRELSRQLLVSLITVRRAYSDLEAAGQIQRRQGQGTFVANRPAGASAAESESEAVRLLTDAVLRARRMGLAAPRVRSIVDSVLTDAEGEVDE